MEGNAGQDRWLRRRTKSTELRPVVWAELVGPGHKTCTGLLVSDRRVVLQVLPFAWHLWKKGFFNAKVLFVPNALNISREIQELSMQSELQITRTQTLMFSSKAHNVLQMRANRKWCDNVITLTWRQLIPSRSPWTYTNIKPKNTSPPAMNNFLSLRTKIKTRKYIYTRVFVVCFSWSF